MFRRVSDPRGVIVKPTRRTAATVLAVVAIAGGLWLNQDRGLKSVANETRSALCALRADKQHQHDAGVKFLKSHPKGLIGDQGGVLISASQIRDGLRDQQSTLNALEPLSC